jgi:hypothetical protein
VAQKIIPEQVLELFREWGAQGGEACARSMTAAQKRERGRKGAIASAKVRRKKARARKAAERMKKRKA